MIVQGAPANPISAVSTGSAARVFVIASPTGAREVFKASRDDTSISDTFSNGSSNGPVPVTNRTFLFKAHGTSRISEKMMAASKPNL